MDPQPRKKLVTTETNMTCCASGAPRPEIEWYKELCLVTESVSIVATISGQYEKCSSLVLSNLSISDIAMYHCNATNTLTETLSIRSAEAELTVLCKLDCAKL